MTKRFISIIGLLIGILFCCPVSAQDIVFTRTQKDTELARKGEIVDWRGDSLTLEVNGRERRIKNEDIIRIETDWSKNYQQAESSFENRDYQNAAFQFENELQFEKRPWVQAIILSRLIQINSLFENHVKAGQYYHQLHLLDSNSRFKNLIPLPWVSGMVDPLVEQIAATWYGSDDVALRLLGASWLLGTNRREKAFEALAELSKHENPFIAQTAIGQIWRTKVVTATQLDHDRLKVQISEMSKRYRAGCVFVSGEILSRLKNKNDAAIQWMKLPILHSDQLLLSAAGLHKTALMIQNTEPEKATILLSEIVREYPGTRFALEANQLLSNLQQNR